MSQPRQSTPASPTPSKSSLRRTSGAQNPSQRSLLPPLSPHFDNGPTTQVRYSPRSPPNQTLEYDSDEDDQEQGSYEERQDQQQSYFRDEQVPQPPLQPNRPFQPFFTLIEDTVTSEHYHPSVHYIFADDDAEIVTEAACRTLDQNEESVLEGQGSSSTVANRLQRREAASASVDTSQARESESYDSRLPAPSAGVKEHYLIIDVHPSTSTQSHIHQPQHSQVRATSPFGIPPNTEDSNAISDSYTVISSASLSSDWQITRSTVTSAPTIGDPTTDNNNEEANLMLRIEGRGFDAAPLNPSHIHGGAQGRGERKFDERDRQRENLEDTIERFQVRLGEIRRLLDMDGMSSGGGGAGKVVVGDQSQPITYTGIGLEDPD